MFIHDLKKELLRSLGHTKHSIAQSPIQSTFPPKEQGGNVFPHSPINHDESLFESHSVDHWGNAFWDFGDYQLTSGGEIAKSGIAPQTAADFQNLMAYQQHHGISEGPFESDGFQPGMFRSHNDFVPYGNPAEPMGGSHGFFEHEPEEMLDMDNPEFMDSDTGYEPTGYEAEAMEDMEHEQQPYEPTEQPMQEPYETMNSMNPEIEDPLDLMNQMGFGSFMDPTGSGGFGGSF